MKTTKIHNERNFSKERINYRPKIKRSIESNPNFRNSFFRSLFQRKSKNNYYYNEGFKNISLLTDDGTHIISSNRYNSTAKKNSAGKNRNKIIIDDKYNTQYSKSKSRSKIRDRSNLQLNSKKKYDHINKEIIDSLSNKKSKNDNSKNKSKRTITNRSNIINNVPKIKDKKKSITPNKIKNTSISNIKPKKLAQIKYKEYPNYSMNINCVLKQVNDFNNGIYGNNLEQESNITSSRLIINNNDNSSIIDEIKNIKEPKISKEKFNKRYGILDDDRSGREIKATKVKTSLKKKSHNYDYKNDKELFYKNNNIIPDDNSNNINEYFVDKNKGAMSPIYSLQNSKQNTENFFKNSLTQNSFSIHINSTYKINKNLIPTLTENFKINNTISVKDNKNNEQKIDNFAIYPNKNWKIPINIEKCEKIENFNILRSKKEEQTKNNNEKNNNIKNLTFNDDDEIINYIKDKIQKIKDSEYNSDTVKYNYFTLSRKFQGKNLYEISLQNNLDEINKIIQNEKIEIEHEPVLFITQKEFNKLKNNEKTNNSNEVEKYKKLASVLKYTNTREEQKYRALENEYNKLLNQKNYSNNENEQYIKKLTEENTTLKTEKEKLVKYIYELQEYNKKLIEHYENKITNMTKNTINNISTFKKNDDNSPFDVVNYSIENNSTKKTPMQDKTDDFQETFTFKEKNTYNNSDSKNDTDSKSMDKIKKIQRAKLFDSNKKKNENKTPNKISVIAKMLEMKLKVGSNNSDDKNNNTNDTNEKILTNNEDIENLIEAKPLILRKGKKKKINFVGDE